MTKQILVFFTIFCTGIISFSQNQINEICSSAILHNELMKTDPEYKARILANEQLLQNEIMKQKLNKGNSAFATVYTIPVVVHVIHLGEAEGTTTNISDAQIHSAIDNLNDAYRNNSPYAGVDFEVEFALAVRDPNCNPTDGIVRVNGTGISDYATNGITTSGSNNQTTIKALSKWPNGSYYNIWIVAGINGNMGGGGIQGYAYFPGASSNVDGAVILYNSFGYDPTGSSGFTLKSYTDMNATTTHELGHAFNLYHTFEGDDGNGDGTADQCPAGDQCGSDLGDCCTDTPPHMRSASDCNTAGTNACDGGSSNALFVHNFMDYSSEACKTGMTADQKTRFRAAITSTRASLTTSLALTPVSGSEPSVSQTCQPNTTDLVTQYGMGIFEFTLGNLTVGSGSAISDGGYVEQWCANTTLDVNTLYSVAVTNNTDIGNAEDVRVYIDYNNDGDFLDAGEQIFSSNANTTHNGSFTTPASPVTGTPVWVRVISDWQGNNITGPCYTPENGQVEDYSVTFNAGAPAPVAAFTASATTVCAGSTVNYTDQSTNTPTGWAWSFQGATPSSSTAQHPSIAYNSAGTYSVSLTATNAGGSDAEVKAGYITVLGVPSVTLTTTNSSCVSSNGTASATVSGGTSPYTYAWSTGGTTSAISSLAAANYTCTVTDNKGCVGTKTVTVNATACGPTSLIPSDCGITVASFNEFLYCIYVPSATDYQYKVSHPATGFTGYYTRGNHFEDFSMNRIPGVGYAKTYNVEVRSKVNGVWGNFGTVCTITTPAVAPTTQLAPAYCGITLTSLNQQMYCVEIVGASNYQYRISHSGSGFIAYYNRGNNNTAFQMNGVPGVEYAKTYDVEVRANIGGVWGNFNTICTVTTPALTPQPKLQQAYCDIVLASLGQTVYCDFIQGATNYQYWVAEPISQFNAYYTRTNSNTDFSMNRVAGVLFDGKTYTVKVRTYSNGAWGSFGPGCTLTMGGSRFMNNVDAINLSLTIFPNPVIEREINLVLSGEGEPGKMMVEITNITGTKVYSTDVFYSGNEIISIPIGDEFPGGMYFISAVINNKRVLQKFIVAK